MERPRPFTAGGARQGSGCLDNQRPRFYCCVPDATPSHTVTRIHNVSVRNTHPHPHSSRPSSPSPLPLALVPRPLSSTLHTHHTPHIYTYTPHIFTCTHHSFLETGISSAQRAERPRCSATRIRCMRAREWTHSLVKHTVSTTTTHTTTHHHHHHHPFHLLLSPVTPGLKTCLRTWTILGSSGNTGLVLRRPGPRRGTAVYVHTVVDVEQFNHNPFFRGD